MPDPGNPQDLNRYSYVRNNPLFYVDPSGHVVAEFLAYLTRDYVVNTFNYFFPPATPSFFGPSSLQAQRLGLLDGESGFGLRESVLLGGSIAAGFAPGVGESLDFQILKDPTSTGFEQGAAGVSLVANALLPFLPNFGAFAKTAGNIGDDGGEFVYHYTSSLNVASINQGGLRGNEVFTTPNGSLSPLQAQLDLALPPNRGLPDALFRIDLNQVRQLGIEFSNPQQIGRQFNLPGGGTEVIIYGPIPPSALKQVR